ncbi:MAG: isoaspartyl peptidase/L-asparaginase [Gemmataceae bacterium]
MRVAILAAFAAAALTSVTLQGEKPMSPKAALVIHGGAGVLTAEEMAGEKLDDGTPLTRELFESALADALEAGHKALQAGSAVDAVEAAVRVMEDCELFNAGRGAALNQDGQAELDAAIMEGDTSDARRGVGKRDGRKRAGAVTGVTHVKNPISAARAVLEMPGSRHVLLSGAGAEAFVLGEEARRKYAIERVSNVYFWTGRRVRQVREVIGGEGKKRGGAADTPDRRFGTVGAVAVKAGKLVAGTSTGGLTNKLPGRVGDTPVPGAGTYADDRACGVSCTGTGELFLRHVVAHDVVARMLYKKLSVGDAARESIDELPDEDGGVGGLIALGREGDPAFAMSKRSTGMYRGFVTVAGEVYVAVYRDERPARMTKSSRGRWTKAGR